MLALPCTYRLLWQFNYCCYNSKCHFSIKHAYWEFKSENGSRWTNSEFPKYAKFSVLAAGSQLLIFTQQLLLLLSPKWILIKPKINCTYLCCKWLLIHEIKSTRIEGNRYRISFTEGQSGFVKGVYRLQIWHTWFLFSHVTRSHKKFTVASGIAVAVVISQCSIM